jgi:hypothetical protein
MPHQFLHHLELGSDTSEQGGIGVPKGMPADVLLNMERFGDRPDVLSKN